MILFFKKFQKRYQFFQNSVHLDKDRYNKGVKKFITLDESVDIDHFKEEPVEITPYLRDRFGRNDQSVHRFMAACW